MVKKNTFDYDPATNPEMRRRIINRMIAGEVSEVIKAYRKPVSLKLYLLNTTSEKAIHRGTRTL